MSHDEDSWNIYKTTVHKIKKKVLYQSNVTFYNKTSLMNQNININNGRKNHYHHKNFNNFDFTKERLDQLQPPNSHILRNITRSKYNIDNIIDLHGHNLDQSYDIVVRAIESAHSNYQKMILIITGNGQGNNSIKENFK